MPEKGASGLTAQQRACLALIQERPGLAAWEVADRLGLTGAAWTLRSLVRRGLARTDGSKPVVYVPAGEALRVPDEEAPRP